MQSPEVVGSVVMTTYNHEAYLAEAIESVLRQRTTFRYEIVIGEDCSTDRTLELAQRCEQEYGWRYYFIYADGEAYRIECSEELR